MKNGKTLWLAVGIFALFAALLLSIISYIAFAPVPGDFMGRKRVAVVFGAGITRSGDPSAALLMRLDKALEFYRASRVEKVIVSGTVPEVHVMASYLARMKMRQGDIIRDVRGENTRETVENSKAYLLTNGVTNGAVFISQRYHVHRIRLIASMVSLSNCDFVAADQVKIGAGNNILFLLRESFAFIKTWLFG